MSRRAARWVLGALLLAGVAAAGPAAAAAAGPAAATETPPAPAKAPAPSIIIVDITQILRDAKAAKGIQAQLDHETESYSKEVSQQENELQKLRDELERQRTVLSQEAYTAKTREYQQRFDTLDKSVQSKRQALQQSYQEAMTKVEHAALEIIADIAKERNANLVLARAAVLFQSEGFDVTDEAVSRLDRTLPSVAVTLPKGGDDGAGKGKGGTKN